MNSPQDRLNAATDRAAEITWWNRAMTKLNDVDGVEGAQSFVLIRTIERKGPFCRIRRRTCVPRQTAAEFLDNLDYHDDIVDAIRREVFGGDPDGQLYQHQAETIKG